MKKERLRDTFYFPLFSSRKYENWEGQISFSFRCIVRHKHEDIWYARLHIYSESAEEYEKALQNFLHQVYLDIKFGKVYLDLKTPYGDPLDPVSEIQVSEKERLGLL